METKEIELSEYDIKLNEEYDRIQAAYKFPISFIHLYDIREGNKENTLFISDGISTLNLCFDDVFIYEGSDRWTFSLGKITIDLHKTTRKIETYIL